MGMNRVMPNATFSSLAVFSSGGTPRARSGAYTLSSLTMERWRRFSKMSVAPRSGDLRESCRKGRVTGKLRADKIMAHGSGGSSPMHADSERAGRTEGTEVRFVYQAAEQCASAAGEQRHRTSRAHGKKVATGSNERLTDGSEAQDCHDAGHRSHEPRRQKRSGAGSRESGRRRGP